MTRITTAVTLMVLGLSATAIAQEYTWVETRFHRVHLRNGNFIDGNVTGLSDREVYLRLKVGEMNIRRDTVERIELLKMRSLLEKPKLDPPLKKMEAAKPVERAVSRNAAEAVVPVPEVSPALKSNVSAILGRMRIANPDQREELLADLARLPNAAPYLASQMGTVNDECVEYVGRALSTMKDQESLPYIAAHLDSNREVVVIQSLKLLGDLEDPNWARMARPLLSHAQAAVRSTAIATLSRLNDKEALPAILDLLTETDRMVRSGAIVASINMGKKFDEIEMVAKQFRMALRNPTREALPDLLSAAGRLQKVDLWDAIVPYLRDSDEDVRGAAAEALGSLVAKDAADALVAQMRMETDRKARLRMAKAAGSIRSIKCVEPLVEWLRDQDEEVVAAANKSLEEITKKRFGPDHKLWTTWLESTRNR